MGFGGDAPPPPQNNPGRDLMRYVKGLGTALPSLTGLEATYRPQFGEMNLADIQGLLGGIGSKEGIIGLGGDTTTAAGQQIGAARDAEFADMRGNVGEVNGILDMLNPQGRTAVNQASTMATDAYNRAMGPLSAFEARQSDQTARAAFGARGRINDNASVAAEILGREDVKAKKRQEAAMLGNNAFNLSSQFTDPSLKMLQGVPASTALGSDYLNTGIGMLGSNTPQLVDTGAGLQMGAQHQSNLAKWHSGAVAADNAADQAHAQFDQAGITATLAVLGSIWSDERLKENKRKVGKTNEGLDIFTYNYKGSPQTHMGVMAQDVKKKQKDALGPVLYDLMTVDYSKIK